jgi:hypothetical protein
LAEFYSPQNQYTQCLGQFYLEDFMNVIMTILNNTELLHAS